MQLPENFSALNFELTNSHLFQQKLMPALQWRHCGTILVVMFLQTVIEVSC